MSRHLFQVFKNHLNNFFPSSFSLTDSCLFSTATKHGVTKQKADLGGNQELRLQGYCGSTLPHVCAHR